MHKRIQSIYKPQLSPIKVRENHGVRCSIQNPRKYQHLPLTMDAWILNHFSTVKLLGVRLGQGKLLNKFITKKVTACNFHLRNSKTIRHCLPKKSKVLIFTGRIIPKLDYCNSLLICSPNCESYSITTNDKQSRLI